MISFRYASQKDADLLFRWVNEKSTRENSFNKSLVNFADHVRWLKNRIGAADCKIYIFTNDAGALIGQVRIENDPSQANAIISISVAEEQRGKGYATKMIVLATADYLEKNANATILAYIFKSNENSQKSFLKAGYSMMKEELVKEVPIYILSKNNFYAA